MVVAMCRQTNLNDEETLLILLWHTYHLGPIQYILCVRCPLPKNCLEYSTFNKLSHSKKNATNERLEKPQVLKSRETARYSKT